MYVHYTTNTFQDNICTVIHAIIKRKKTRIASDQEHIQTFF